MADTKRYNSVKPKQLASDLTSSGTTLKLTEIKDWGGTNDLTAGQFSDYIPATLINDSRSKIEFVLLTASTIANYATTGITIYKRGLKYYAEGDSTDNDEVTANKLAWTAGETKVLLGTNPPNMYGGFPNKDNDETITGAWTFTGQTQFPLAKRPTLDGDGDTTTDEDLVTYGQLSRTAIAGAVNADTTHKGIVEIATESEINADTGTGGTGATIVTDPATLATSKYGVRLPGADEKDALAGTSGTPSTSNKYVTNDDTAVTATADKVVRADGSGKIDDDYIPNRYAIPELEAYENLTAGDLIKLLNDGGTGKLAKLVGLGEENANSFSSQNLDGVDFCKLSDNKIVMGYGLNGSANSYFKILTINADKTITVGSSATFSQATNNLGVYLCRMEDDKFFALCYQNGAISEAYAIAGSVSGTTITLGSAQAVTGDTSFGKYIGACAKAETDVALIMIEVNGNLRYKKATLTGTSISIASVSDSSMIDWDGNNASSQSGIYLERLEDNKFFFCCLDSSSNLEIQIATLSGTTLTGGTSLQIESSGSFTDYNGVVIDSGGVAVAYGYDSASQKSVYVNSYSISGTTITLSDSYEYENANEFDDLDLGYDNSGNLYLTATFDTTGTYLFMLGVNSNYKIQLKGKQLIVRNTVAIVQRSTISYDAGKIVKFSVTPSGSSTLYSVVGSLDCFDCFGIIGENINTGNSGRPAVLGMVDYNQTSLSPSFKYYINFDNSLVSTDITEYDSLDWDAPEIGRALSSTDLLITK